MPRWRQRATRNRRGSSKAELNNAQLGGKATYRTAFATNSFQCLSYNIFRSFWMGSMTETWSCISSGLIMVADVAQNAGKRGLRPERLTGS